MKVLVLDAFDPESPQAILADAAVEALQSQGHQVTRRVLVGGPFEVFMSADERREYHGDQPLLSPETVEDAAALKAADGLLFCYPTTMHTIPAVLKSWLERVLVPGVAFVFDERERVRPGMTNIRRLGAVTATNHGRLASLKARNSGKRTLLWNIRLSCHRLARRTWVAVPADAPDPEAVRKALSRW